MRSHAALDRALPAARSGAEASNLLATLWEKYLPLMQERLSALDQAAAACRQGTLDAGQRMLAIDAAHKFAGSLGMFGYAAGTDAARSIEHLLLQSEFFDTGRLQSLVGDLHAVLDL